MAHEFFNDDMLLPGDDIAIGSVHEKSFGLAVEVDLAELEPLDVVDGAVDAAQLGAIPTQQLVRTESEPDEDRVVVGLELREA